MCQRLKTHQIAPQLDLVSLGPLFGSFLDLLNDDVILYLCNNALDASTLAKCTMANHRLRQVCGADFVWKKKLIDDYGADWQNALSFMERKSISTGRGLDLQFAYGLFHSPHITVRRTSSSTRPHRKASRTVAISVLGSAGSGKSTLIGSLSEKSTTALTRSSPARAPRSEFFAEVLSTTFLEAIDSQDLIQCLLVEGSTAKSLETQAAVIVFDLNDRQSFCNVQAEWKHLMALFEETKQPRCILVGTKADAGPSRRKVTAAEARELASSLKCRYVETTVADKRTFDAALCQLVSTVVERQPLLLAMDKVVSHKQLPSMANNAPSGDEKQKPKKNGKFGSKLASLLRKSITGI
eukprot:TRINITY_DN14116_c0_g1_i1.p1 TRINITY_DN14116_c0_g1~~TRINITY_DN14116_c0_g1_i1.p1  ORF type:complete len:353 (-),score=48.40 TRINITY_DN14116_c0_g1_i1:15-1073(-)